MLRRKTNITNGCRCPAIYNNLGTFICRLMQLIVFRNREILFINLYMFIHVFNYMCLKCCRPPEMQECLHAGWLVKLFSFGLPSRKFDQSFLRAFLLFPFTKWPNFGATHA